MATVIAAMPGVPITLQTAGATTGAGVVVSVPANFKYHRFAVIGSAGIASGTVQPETATDPAYAGTWQTIVAGITAVASSEVDATFIGVLQFIRARISTTIGSGSVTVTYIGN